MQNDRQWLDELRDEYARSKPTAGQIGRLLEEFGEEEPGVMLAAVRTHMRSSRWWPQVAELLPHVRAAREAAQDAAAQEAQAERLYHSAATLYQRGIEAFHRGDLSGLDNIIQRLMAMGQEYAAVSLQARRDALLAVLDGTSAQGDELLDALLAEQEAAYSRHAVEDWSQPLLEVAHV